MFTQPRVNDIASLYQGNPGALQQRVQKEQQAKPGLPPDLQKLLALQIITNEQDAAKRNAAMQQLQQAGQQPTVAQSVEQRAKQALQSRMLQEQQKQQGLQALMQGAPAGPVPAGVPQPERQPEPQGLDQLASNIGEFAGGGIIAFPDGGEVDREEAARKRIARNLMSQGTGYEGMGIVDFLTAMKDKALSALGGSEERTLSAQRQAAAERQNVRNEAAMGPLMAGYVPRMSEEQQRDADALAKQGPPVQEAPPAPPQAAPRAAPRAAAAAKETPPSLATAAQAAAPAPATPTPREGILAAAMERNPEFAAADRRAEYMRMVGDRPTGSLETLAQEIASQRQRVSERADPLREYLLGIANAPRGMRSLQALAYGSQAADKTTAAREAQLLDLMKQEMDVRSKIEEAKFGQKEKLFTLGDEERKSVYDKAFNAAKEQGLDDREAKKIAADAVQKAADRANAIKVAQIQANASITRAGDPNTAAAINAVKNDEVINGLQKRLDAASKMPGTRARTEAADLQRQIAARQAAIYAAFKVSMPSDTMPAAPGATSPGGTAPSGWGKAQVVK